MDGQPKPDNYLKFVTGRDKDRRIQLSKKQSVPGLPTGWKEATFIGSEEALQHTCGCSTPLGKKAPAGGPPSTRSTWAFPLLPWLKPCLPDALVQ